MNPAASDPDPPTSFLRGQAGSIVGTATVLAILYFGRDVLVPITLAGILSLLIAPLVRFVRRCGAGQTLSVAVAVLTVFLAVATSAAVIATQAASMAANLPRYEHTLRRKAATLTALSVQRLPFLDQAGHMLEPAAEPHAPASPGASVPAPLPVEIHAPQPTSLDLLAKVLGSIWVPLETAGIVLVVLIFLLLEHEAVRDRFIRLAGGTDIRATTLALNDAGERLSRFFVSQFLVNLGVGCAVGLGLSLIGLPHGLLWGAMTGMLRFVPYIGVWIAALFSVLLAAAVDPSWSPAVDTLSLFVLVELIASQLVEPQLYGHSTGLSPLSVVIAAIFWSWLWGPVGLIVSTPLTLCLVVAGRHIKALSMLDVLLGNTQALTMPQRFYQRALSGDSQEIIASGRAFLRRNAFAAYCDVVLMPALALARIDLDTGAITRDQQIRVRDVMVSVIAALGGAGRKFAWRPARSSVLDQTSVGRQLRAEREALAGPFQGPLKVPPGSITLCVGMGSTFDDLATELLVRILRDQKMDARHLSIEDLQVAPPPESTRESIGAVCLVSAFPSEERARGETVAQAVRTRFPGACLVSVFLPGLLPKPAAADSIRTADKQATSFGHAVQICLGMQAGRAEPQN